MTPTKVSFQFGDRELTLETGRLAKQATGSVLTTMGQTVVLSTVVGKTEGMTDRDFFPLTVDYQERTYAAGKIPGGFFKREGRPTEKETLTCRLIDRPIRPLFPEGFNNEVQIICTVLSLDPAVDPDIPALIGASAALSISGLPFNGPIAAARVGYKDGQYILNPSFGALADSQLDLVVAGTESSVLMVESEAKQLSEEVMLGAVVYGHEQFQVAIRAIKELQSKLNCPTPAWEPPPAPTVLAEAVRARFASQFAEAYSIVDKMARRDRLSALRAEVKAAFIEGDAPAWTSQEIASVVETLEYDTVRSAVIAGKPRIDGRSKADVRAIHVEAGLLPRTHGSALFTRGETQALVCVALGTERDSQIIDAIEGERREPFMFHYNFPPFSVGETGRVG
jgi:polyribonucleotide nucleotidyltransferase